MDKMMRIGDAASILRCQVPRRQAETSDIWEWAGEDGGAPAHFVPPAAGTPVIARLGPRSEKFVLRQNDILISTAGTLKTVAAMAFVAIRPERRLIPTKNVLIVRPDPTLIDPVWTYYRLAQADIRERLASSAAGGRSRYLAPEAIAAIEIAIPDDTEMKSIHAAHKMFLEGFWAASTRIEKELREWERIGELTKGK